MRIARRRPLLRAAAVALAGLALLAPPAPAQDAAAGRTKAATCRTCHGIEGVGKMPDVPNIGGEGADYLVNQLNAFKSGARKHEQMSIIAQGLSEQDIADLAAWYASIEFSVKLPE